MAYVVKEIFYTLQGEGANAGRPAVFCRFAGCNLWSGREEDRATAQCRFCDTDFVGYDGDGGGKFETATQLATTLRSYWAPDSSINVITRPFCVLTGGEPLLQVDAELIAALHTQQFEIAIETNGTLEAPAGIDWICVSPKAGSSLRLTEGHELKVVMPQAGLDLAQLAQLKFQHYFIQPMDGLLRKQNTELAIRLCLTDPRWRLSVQTHKVTGIR